MSSHFDDVAAFPLCWPEGWPRTASRKSSQFRIGSVYEATQGLLEQLRLMRAANVVVSTSIPLRRDGLPLSKPPVDGDVGAAVYFMRKGKPLCLACDQYASVEDNIHAIAKTIEALRGIERWGSTDLLDRAFTGFAALPAGRSCWEVLGIPPGSPEEKVDSAYRALAKRLHPDAGGTEGEMAELNRAREEAKG